MGSLTASIDLQRGLGKPSTYKLIYPGCCVLGAACNVYILHSTAAAGRRKPLCKGKLKFCCPSPPLSDLEILKSLICLSLICHGVILVKNPSTNKLGSGWLRVNECKGNHDKCRKLQIFDKMSQRIVFACSSMGRT